MCQLDVSDHVYIIFIIICVYCKPSHQCDYFFYCVYVNLSIKYFVYSFQFQKNNPFESKFTENFQHDHTPINLKGNQNVFSARVEFCSELKHEMELKISARSIDHILPDLFICMYYNPTHSKVGFRFFLN